MCVCNVGLLQGMWSNFLPSWFLERPSAIIGTILITTRTVHTHGICFYSCKGLLLHKHLYVKEQPLLHTCRERVSQLSFVFEPGLRLSTVTMHPSSYPCIDIATDVISDCFKERRDVNSFGNGPEASEATRTSSGEAGEMDLKWCRRKAVHNWLLS